MYDEGLVQRIFKEWSKLTIKRINQLKIGKRFEQAFH